MRPLASHPVRRLSGTVRPPGDKSISHRALMLGAMALGRTTVRGLLEGEDVLHTAQALCAMGAQIERDPSGAWLIDGVGVGGLHEPDHVLDFGNSGTSARLMAGLLATHPFTSFITGDASLRRRPMQRVIEPLTRFGANFVARAGGRLPMAIQGTATPMPVRYAVPVPSAQVKSAVLLAGLNTAGDTVVIEREATRDHSELMLAHFGATLRRRDTEHGVEITLAGHPDLRGRDIEVPSDPSSAAFAVVAACIAADSDVLVRNVGLNPLRAGLFETLREMGADLEFLDRRDIGGETVADIRVRRADLRGIDVPALRAPSMIDEYPILAVAAACAKGRTTMHGLAELRVKESDRLAAIAAGLAANGVKHEMGADSLSVEGGAVAGGGTVATHMDHRIAMSFLILGMAARKAVIVDDGAMIDTSFPGFAALMNGLGARIEPA